MSSEEQLLMELLDCVLDGTASDEERRRFARLVEDRHDLTAEFVEQLRMHSLLQWKSNHLNVPAPQTKPSVRESRIAPNAASSGRGSRRAPSRRAQWATAAILLLSVGAGFGLYSAFGRVSQTPIADVVQNRDARWDDASAARVQGKLVYPGNLELVSGRTSLRLRNGATVSLTGPVSLRIDPDWMVHLNRGRAMAEVPHTIKGFTIDTPSAAVIDRGTRFQVDAREDGGTDVVVYDGAVDVQRSIESPTLKTCLRQQEAARIDPQGNIVRLVHFEQEPMSDQWKGVRPLPALTIHAAWDNLWSTKEESHYLTNARGLADDCRAYVDHPHEWNGLTSEGLPKFLQYADYVRTFNDYRYLAELEIYVDLSRPAWLYVIYDDRSPVPAWLSEQFEDTGVKVGLDEGPWEGTPNLSLGVGPGRSVDNAFTVWRRRCDKPGTVKLGAMVKGAEARAMYGIAAAPLD